MSSIVLFSLNGRANKVFKFLVREQKSGGKFAKGWGAENHPWMKLGTEVKRFE